jgi:hypothetical protein
MSNQAVHVVCDIKIFGPINGKSLENVCEVSRVVEFVPKCCTTEFYSLLYAFFFSSVKDTSTARYHKKQSNSKQQTVHTTETEAALNKS